MNRETKLNIAFVHDHLAQDGGAERVLRVFQETFPGSPTHVLVVDEKKTNPFFRTQDIRTSFIQRLPFGVRKYQWYLPLMITAIEQFDFRGYDVVLSSSSALSKGIVTGPDTLHISYCHTPTRFLWTETQEYLEELRIPRIVKWLLPFYLSRLRVWDQAAANRVDVFLANSNIVKNRIKKYYKRDAIVLHPPISLSKYQPSAEKGEYFVIGGRLVSYKRIDLAISACNELRASLKIFGSGPSETALKKIAGPTIQFLGRISEQEKIALIQKAKAFLYPQVEDFGITAIEAMACGRPVIALSRGGALETVVEGVTGIFFHEQTVESLREAIKRFSPNQFQAEKIRERALRFDEDQFKNRLFDLVHEQFELFTNEHHSKHAQ